MVLHRRNQRATPQRGGAVIERPSPIGEPNMAMSLEYMKAQLTQDMGRCPIPDGSLLTYAATLADLSDQINMAAKALQPEDEAAGFSGFLDSFAQTSNHAF